MDPTRLSTQTMVNKIKKDILSNLNADLLLSPSAYETAWIAMIPDPHEPNRPLFWKCLNWIVQNQYEEGFWRDYDGHDQNNLESFLATIMCLVALRRWNASEYLVNRGLDFIYQNAEKIMKDHAKGFPRWFSICFPGVVENAKIVGLQVIFPESLEYIIADLFYNRQEILKREKLVDTNEYFPLLSYLESLPSKYEVDEDIIVRHLKSDGSLFNSPSATASAYLATGNEKSLSYLKSLVNKSVDGGVSSSGRVDEEQLKLITVNQLVRLGLSNNFNKETEDMLQPIHRSYMHEKDSTEATDMVGPRLFTDSLAFWLLRLHGYDVSPSIFCWFLHQENIRDHIEKNYKHFLSVLLNIYRATDLMFSRENDLEEVRSFSKKLLQQIVMEDAYSQNIEVSPSLKRVIQHELAIPWIARLDHLEHRMWMEESDASVLWMGKFSFQRLLFKKNHELSQVAYQNYVHRQSVYRNELEEIKRWSKSNGLCDMGFGREKTTYCYFAVASSTSLPDSSYIRTLVAKSAIIITVADDFFDEEASLHELEKLTKAVKRWDNGGLCGHSKIMFDALDGLVTEVVGQCFQQGGHDIRDKLQRLWQETFEAWLKEATWGQGGCAPPTNEYLTTAMASIAAHTLVLPASSFLQMKTPPYHKIWTTPYPHVTKLLMVTSRLLNDIQSYLKEQKEGNVNFLLLYLKENPEANMEDAISHAQMLLNERKKELLQHILMDDINNDTPKPIKLIHLSCFKVFQMFFNSSNRYDSETDVLHDINKAIFAPPKVQRQKIIRIPKPPPQYKPRQKKVVLIVHKQYDRFDKLNFPRNFVVRKTFGQALAIMCEKKMHAPLRMGLCHI